MSTVARTTGTLEKADHTEIVRQLRGLLDQQRTAFLTEGPPDAPTRIDRLDRAIDNEGPLLAHRAILR